MKASTIAKTISKYKELEDKVFKIIADTYDCNIDCVTGISVDGDCLDINWNWHCRGCTDCDSKMIPVKWLEDGFDYKAAYEETAKPCKRKIKQHRSIVAYRAKNSDNGNWIMYTYGSMCDKPIEGSTMKDLAYNIAYLYHRHPVELYASYDGKKFTKASGALAKAFSKIMDDEFRYDEWRH